MKRFSIAFCLSSALLLNACAGEAPVATTAGALPAQRGHSAKAFSIGSFNSDRGGAESLESSEVAGLAAAITAMFHPKFHFAPRLTTKFLARINVLVIGVAASVTGTEIKPLSSSERAALLAFVESGGALVIFADNSDFQKADNSLLTPFGLKSTGKLYGNQVATWVGGVSQNPLASGPAGTPQELDTYYPGWFKELGAARDLADFPGSGAPAAAYLPAGALSAQSGPVVFFADSSLMLDGTRTNNDQIAILNAIALGS